LVYPLRPGSHQFECGRCSLLKGSILLASRKAGLESRHARG
jgi:hypothetical protein